MKLPTVVRSIALALLLSVSGYGCAMKTEDAPMAQKTNANQPASGAAASGADKTSREAPADLDFTSTFAVRNESGKRILSVKYRLRNKGSQSYLLYDRGDVLAPGRDTLYVEPQSDGVVEISRRGYVPPTDPAPAQVIYPGGTILEPNQTREESVELTVGYMTARKPYMSVQPVLPMPDPVKRVRFCLGVAPLEGLKTSTIDTREGKVIVPDFNGLWRQRLLCSEPFDLSTKK